MAEDSLELGMAIVSSLEGDEAGRQVLAAFAEGIAYTNEIGSDLWAVTHSKNWGVGGFLCLYAGSWAHLVGCVGLEGRVGADQEPRSELGDAKTIWLALGEKGEASELAGGVLNDPKLWLWENQEGFKRFASSTGTYGITSQHAQVWPGLMRAWTRGLSNATARARRLKSDYQPLHLPEVVDRIAAVTGLSLPQPTYLDTAGSPPPAVTKRKRSEAAKRKSRLTRPIKLTAEDLQLLHREVVGEGGFQSLLRQLKRALKGDVLNVDSDTFERMERYSQRYGDGGWERRLGGLVERLTAPPEGAFAVGDQVRHQSHGEGEVLFCMNGFPKAKVRFAHGVEKVPLGELKPAD